MKKNFFIIYNLTISLVFTLVSVVSAHTFFETITAFIYLPLVLYFTTELIRRAYTFTVVQNKMTQIIKSDQIDPFPITKAQLASQPSITKNISPVKEPVIDHDRRIFLKLIGSAGISVFMLALFTKKAQAAFFGSVPGPGTIALKDSSGNKIDPAQHHPTAGYKVSQVDDTGSTNYYGFIHKSGAWYIQKEDNSGNYRYTKGDNGFTTNWTNRAVLSYDYFDNVF